MDYIYDIGCTSPDSGGRVVAVGHVIADCYYPVEHESFSIWVLTGDEIIATTTQEDTVLSVWHIDNDGYPSLIFDISVDDFYEWDKCFKSKIGGLPVFSWDEWDGSYF